MTMSLQTSSLLTQAETPADPNNPLQTEYGWTEVAKGLTRILIGYFILIVGMSAGIAVLMLAVYGREWQIITKGNKNTTELIGMLGVGLIGLGSLLSYGFILAGKWRCLMNAPERKAAKWLIFSCMLCMVIGPVLNILTSMGGDGAKNYKQLRNLREGNTDLTFESIGSMMQLVGTVLSITSTLLFILFLRAVASCFKSGFLVAMIHLYLIFSALLLGVTGQLILVSPRSLARPDVFLALGLGWLGCGLGYLFLVIATRICISNGASRIRSPLAV